MQSPTRRIAVAIAALLASSFVLSACGFDSAPSTDSNDASTYDYGNSAIDLAPVDTNPAPAGVSVYPAVGKQIGVVKHGVSVKTDPNKGLTYTCARGLKSATVPFDRSVTYDGVNIAYYSYDPNTGPDDTLDDQMSVGLTFSGNTLTFKAVSLIVTAASVNVGTTDDPFYQNMDESVVNLNPKWFNSKGITLNNIDFVTGSGYISDVEFCINP